MWYKLPSVPAKHVDIIMMTKMDAYVHLYTCAKHVKSPFNAKHAVTDIIELCEQLLSGVYSSFTDKKTVQTATFRFQNSIKYASNTELKQPSWFYDRSYMLDPTGD